MNEREIFMEALDRSSPEDRRAYLDKVCGENINLRRRVETLLQSHEDAGSFLEHPATADIPTFTFEPTSGLDRWASGAHVSELGASQDDDQAGQFVEATDNTLRIWDRATGEELCCFDPGKAVQSVVFSPDGCHIFSGGRDGLLRLWRVPEDLVVEKAKPALNPRGEPRTPRKNPQPDDSYPATESDPASRTRGPVSCHSQCPTSIGAKLTRLLDTGTASGKSKNSQCRLMTSAWFATRKVGGERKEVV
ncbi:MAG: WD40 repeat domain-containing protein [Planctomycetota bacterium]